MQKEFVSYEQALALKELGFNEKCFTSYDSEQRLRSPFDCKEDYELNISYIEDSLGFCENSKLSSGFISAPLYQQVFRWFREKYKLVVDIRSEHLGYYTSIVDREKMMRIVMKPVNIFETYEEAEQACLDKLIEIVKK